MPKPVIVVDTLSDHDPEKPNHMILWLDTGIGKPEEYQHLKRAFGSNTDPRNETWTMLTDRDYDNLLIGSTERTVLFEGVVFLLQAFTTEKDCLDAFERNQDKRIFFISSGSMGKEAVPKVIERYQRVFTDPITNKPYNSIYLFCHNIAFHVEWATEYIDYVQMFDFDSCLLERLTRDISQYFLECGRRLREHYPSDALQRLHWAKKLCHQHEKIKQKFSTDKPRVVQQSDDIKVINSLIQEVETSLEENSRHGNNSDTDDDESMDVQTGASCS